MISRRFQNNERFDLAEYGHSIKWDVSELDTFSVSARVDPLTSNNWTTSGVAVNVHWSTDGFNPVAFVPVKQIAAGGGSLEHLDVADKRYVHLLRASTTATSVFINLFGVGKALR